MSVEMACDCDGLPAHSHIGRWTSSGSWNRAWWEDTGDVRIWVDWKAVARALSQETAPSEAVNHAH